jgi:HSP20 family protein
MSLVRWQRPQNLGNVVDEMDRMFRELARFPWVSLPGGEFEWGPAVDVYETENEVVIKANLAGAKKEDVEVNATEEALTIHGEMKKEEEIKEEGYYRRELRYGTFHRVIPWPSTVDSENISAKFDDGILEIRAAKTEKAKGGKKIEVK